MFIVSITQDTSSVSSASQSEVLTAPKYDGYGTLGFGGENPVNSNADYTVVYKNNAQPYTLKEGGTGFDKTAAPQVTITGKGTYFGSLTIYFTIGAGEMRLGDFEVCGAKNAVILYDGNEHQAWNAYAVEFKVDEGDKGQFSQLEDGQYIPTCSTSEAMYWYGQDWSDPNQIEYSTDDQKTWIMEKEFGSTAEQMYMITDAGEYPFYIRVTNKACGTVISEKLTAKITPKDLSKVTYTPPADVIAYYTGKPVIPTAWDSTLVDKELNHTLVRDKDFIITGKNNTEISKDNTPATVTITGTGNYKGELSGQFQIKSAFTLKQTTISTQKWYSNNAAYWKDGGVPVLFHEGNVSDNGLLTSMGMKSIVYRDSKEEAAGLSDQMEFYTSLEDAIAGTNPGYTFTKEGINTQKLYGKDPETGYISGPVDVTLKIDTTAPTWEDENGNTEGFGIQIQENWWRKLLNTVSFGNFYNDNTLKIKIKANDKKKGVDAVSGITQEGACYYCYIQKIDDAADGEAAVMTKGELDELSQNTSVSDINDGFVRVSVGSGGVGTVDVENALKNDGNYIVYAYAVDNAGNKSDYISTEGIVVDTTKPEVTITDPNKEDGTLKDIEATFKVNLNEDATLLYFYVDKSKNGLVNADSISHNGSLACEENGKWKPAFAENGELVTIAVQNGTEIKAPAYKAEAKKGMNEILITGLQPSENFDVWMAAIDKAGNISEYSVTKFTTTKAIPKITTDPVVSGIYGDKTKDLKITQEGVAEYNGVTVPGKWSISVKEDDTHIWKVNDTEKCQVNFIPDDTTHYEQITGDISVKVEKAIPVIAVNPKAELTYGESLDSAVLSGGIVKHSETDDTVVAGTFAWKDSAMKPVVADSDNKKFAVVFTPTDTVNYDMVETQITVKVKKAPVAPNMPCNTISAANSKETVKDVTLPVDWNWKEADREKELPVGVAVTATAEYNGADKGNYETESIDIVITRSTCEHVAGEILYSGEGEKAPTCTEDGLGHRECTICHVVIESGIKVAAEHSFSSEWTIDKPATTTEEGSKSHHCTKCDARTDITVIPKLSSGGSSSGGGTSSGTTTNPKQDEEKPGDGDTEDDNKPSDDNKPADDSKPAENKPAAVGTKLTKSGITYKVTSVKGKTPTVTYTKVSKKAKGTVTIPKTVTIDGVKYQVTAIANNAFAGNKNVTKIVIPDTVKAIGKKAFANCPKLKTIVIKSTKLTSKNMDAKAFAGITKDVVILVPKKKLAAYKKLLVKKGLGKKVKLKVMK